MSKKGMLAATVALALVSAAPAGADPILFNPTGGGAVGAYTINAMDQLPGNAIAENVTVQNATLYLPGSGDPLAGTSFTLAYQANLNSTTGLAPQYEFGEGGVYFTFTAEFNEFITAAGIVGSTAVLEFGLDTATSPNIFNMYVAAAPGDDLAGTGFDTGTLILSGHAVQTTGPLPSGQVDFSDVFTFQCINPTGPGNCNQPLDQGDSVTGGPPVNDYPGARTLPGVGNAFIPVEIDFAAPGYFPNLLVGTNLAFAITNTSLFIPFITADPSALFFNGIIGAGSMATGCGGIGSGPSIPPCVNGFSGPNTILSADANTSFRLQQEEVVPEPATLILLGLGLLGSAAARRRQKQGKK